MFFSWSFVVSNDLQMLMQFFNVRSNLSRSHFLAATSGIPVTILSLIKPFSRLPKLYICASVLNAVMCKLTLLFGSWIL